MINDQIVAYMICEQTSMGKSSILDDKQGGVKIYSELQDSSEFNRNGRNYPAEILAEGLSNPRIQELIQRKQWCGEAGHPIKPTLERQMDVAKDNISHRILSYEVKGAKIMGVVKTAPTLRGKEMRDFILDTDAMETAYSLRALGPITKTARGNIVGRPLTIITYDWVFYPSHANAYQQQIMEAVNKAGNTLTESVILPILENSAVDFIKHESKNYRMVSEYLQEYDQSEIYLGEGAKSIIVENTQNKDRIVIGVESFIGNEINSYFNKFK